MEVKGLAIIPTIYESPYFDDLCSELWGEDVKVIAVCNRAFDGPLCADGTYATHLQRPTWGIYRTWNFGMRLGAHLGVPVLVLNDDIILEPGAATTVCDELAKGDWAVLGFDYKPGWWRRGPSPTYGTYRHGGVGGFAFGVNPKLCARTDRRFKWWGGDDDLMFATRAAGGKVGIMGGAGVRHPQPSLSAHAHPELLPEGWYTHDRELLQAKWGDPF